MIPFLVWVGITGCCFMLNFWFGLIVLGIVVLGVLSE